MAGLPAETGPRRCCPFIPEPFPALSQPGRRPAAGADVPGAGLRFARAAGELYLPSTGTAALGQDRSAIDHSLTKWAVQPSGSPLPPGRPNGVLARGSWGSSDGLNVQKAGMEGFDQPGRWTIPIQPAITTRSIRVRRSLDQGLIESHSRWAITGRFDSRLTPGPQQAARPSRWAPQTRWL